MMGYWEWGHMGYGWLIPLVVLALAAWLIIRATGRYRGRRG
jgi:hypothetical protein